MEHNVVAGETAARREEGVAPVEEEARDADVAFAAAGDGAFVRVQREVHVPPLDAGPMVAVSVVAL